MRPQELHPRTALLNKQQKITCKLARQRALRWLARKFPNAFDNSITIRPLKLGIMEDVLKFADEAAAQGISASKLRQAVVVFTRRVDYLTCLKAREMRVDLDGNETIAVTEGEAEVAAVKLKKRVEKSLRNSRRAEGGGVYKDSGSAWRKEYNYSNTNPQPAVIVKRKVKQVDDYAVERLKSKLGLKRERECTE